VTRPGSGTAHLSFSVDTHVFRELGKLLVGRDSTALVELVKNSYDADATRVVLHAENVDSPDGVITVTDDGKGMTYDQFAGDFLRIAGRSKESEGRRSKRFRRRYTGAKGIGRLSAYKLAARLGVESLPAAGDGVQASVDWEALENSEGDVQDSKLVRAQRVPAGRSSAGTSLTLTGLRLDLAHGRKQRFLREVRATRPDPNLHAPDPAAALGVTLLVPDIPIADAAGPPFVMELSGDLDPGDQPWPSLLANIDWVLEVDAREPRVRYRVSPTSRRVKEQPAAGRRDFVYDRDDDGPRFVARVLVRGGKRGERLPDLLDAFIGEISGIRVYMEGFRVLPYGSPGNDWLQIDADAVRRSTLQYGDAALPDLRATDERTYQLSGRNYIGAVFLHEESSGGLEMVVNREGFMPGPAMDEMTALVRRGIDLSVRVRAAVGATDRDQEREAKDRRRQELLDRLAAEAAARSGATPPPASGPAAPAGPTPGAASQLESLMDAATEAASGLRAGTGGATQPAVDLVRAALHEARQSLEGVRDEQAQLRVLASVGTQFGAFIHEVNAVLAQARIVLGLLDALVADEAVNAAGLRRARRIRTATRELAASLERQAIYLTDTIGAEARRRRSKQRVADRLATARRLLEPAAARRTVDITEDVPRSVRTPPMFPAEVNIVLTNLISNAIKAAAIAPGGRVHVSSDGRAGVAAFRVDNTGVRVDLNEAERWFLPFETTTADLDDALGQGMGLGLPLTRRIVEEYGGQVRFVEPLDGYATGVLVTLPTGRG
jgi:signal transduction histidine kinase